MIFVQHHSVEPEKLKKKKETLDKIKSEDTTDLWKNYKHKEEIRLDLLELQYGLCAYCENSLYTQLKYHIEHIAPKNIYPDLTFEYSNLILSCIDSDGLRDVKVDNTISCGHAKENKFNSKLFIKPTFQDCEQYFWYKDNGEVISNPELNAEDIDKANYTIKLLKLNCNRLKRERKQIILEGYTTILELLNETNVLDKFIRQQVCCLENGNFPPFINARKQHFLIYMSNPTSKTNKLAQDQTI